ncbi:MAG TPA: SLC13 family permease [Beijerinckiaceae bacterium]
MTLPQIFAFLILGAMMVLFVWGRLRYDLVALLALLAAVLVGIVPHKKAFEGFSDDIVIIVGSALVVSAAVARSGVLEVLLSRISPYLGSVQAQIVVLVGAVTLLSSFVKNIGALAMMIPIALQMAKRAGASPSYYLMPMAFGSLLGGLITLVGTSPNIIVARVREEMTGQPFGMFDYTPVGLGLAAAGVAFLAVGYRLLPKGRKATAGLDEALDIKDYVTEARVAPGSAAIGQTVADLKRLADGDVAVTGLLRNRSRSATPLPDATLRADDIVLLKGEPDALERAVARGELELEGEDRPTEEEDPSEEVGVVEAIVTGNSVLAGQSAGRMALHERHHINLIAVSRAGARVVERLRDVKLRAGDVIALQGNLPRMPERLRDLGCLPLAERSLRLGSVRRGLIPVAVLAGAMILTAVGVLPVGIAFFGAAVLMLLLGAIPLREAYEAVEWPILIMLGALIPVSEAIRTTGGTDLIAGWLSVAAQMLPAWGALALIMAAAMAVTPFLNNAATVLVMAPIAASFAGQLGYRPDAFLMAVAVGAACDFLTPIGHQCNTLVMGPGGYRFGDYWRLGAPLSAMVLVLGVGLILLAWPLR